MPVQTRAQRFHAEQLAQQKDVSTPESNTVVARSVPVQPHTLALGRERRGTVVCETPSDTGLGPHLYWDREGVTVPENAVPYTHPCSQDVSCGKTLLYTGTSSEPTPYSRESSLTVASEASLQTREEHSIPAESSFPLTRSRARILQRYTTPQNLLGDPTPPNAPRKSGKTKRLSDNSISVVPFVIHEDVESEQEQFDPAPQGTPAANWRTGVERFDMKLEEKETPELRIMWPSGSAFVDTFDAGGFHSWGILSTQ